MGTATIDIGEQAARPRHVPGGQPAQRTGTVAAGALADAVLVGALLVLTWRIGVKSTDFTGTPKGADTLGHVATVQLLMENFPHLMWNPAWFGSMPSVPGLYPPGYALMIAAVVTETGTSIQHAMVECCAVAYLVMAASIYGFVRVIAKSRTAAALAGLLVLAAPALWVPSLQVGEYPRLTAMAFGYLATFIAALYTIKPTRVRFTAAVVVTGAAFATHPITGGLGALQVLGVLVLVPYRPRRARLRTAGAAAAAMAGLAAWLYVPSLVGVHAYYILPQARFETPHETSFGYLLHPAGGSLTAFSPILLPLALLLTGITALVAWRLRPGADGSFWRAVGSSAAMMIVVLCVLGYAFVGRVVHHAVELVGVYPNDMFSYAAWPLAATSGVLIASLLSLVPREERPTWGVTAFAVALAGAIACVVAMTPILGRDAYSYEHKAYAVAPLLPGSDGTGQYRLGLTDQTESSWVSMFTRVPEIGGPFNQGALNLDYIDWAESVLTDPAPPVAEAEFLTQWNSLRWIEAAPAQQGFYQHNPQLFRYLGPSGAYRNYEVLQPSPILAATDTPPVLVIGSYDNYNLVLRSLAVTDQGPSQVIPVEGAAYIDDYSLAELEQFPVLFLYGFQAHNPARAAELIDAYVRAGGGIIADVAGSEQLSMQLVQDGAPLPVGSWTQMELSGAWGFRNSRSPLTQGLDLNQFSPAFYAVTQPYLIDAAQQLAPGTKVALDSGAKKLAPGTQVALGSEAEPLLVTDAVGHGLVIESGINLPYHDAVFSNTTESLLLARMIQTATARWWASGQPAQAAVALGADSARIHAGPAEGVLFKQTDTPDWHATVDGHAAATYPAGPGYVYVPLASSARAPATVQFRYQLSKTEWGSIILSVLTGLLLLGFLCGVRLPRRLRQRLELAFVRLWGRFLPQRGAVRETRQRLAELMTDPSPAVRRAALLALPIHNLEPYADLLAARLRKESDVSVLDAMRDTVIMHQWEPMSTPALFELRRWAAGLGHPSAAVRQPPAWKHRPPRRPAQKLCIVPVPHNRHMRVRAGVAAALTLTGLAAVTGLAVAGPVSAALAAPTGVRAEATWVRDQASWIRSAQLSDGAIQEVPGFGRILPYIANYAALGLARAAGELHDQADADAAWRWLTWYQAHQDAAGFVTDYVVTGSIETSTQTYDSTDAYAGTFLSAVAAAWQADPDQARLKSLARGVTQAVAAIAATQTADGLTWASPGYHVKLLMDNAEAYGGLRSAVTLATALGEPAVAARATRDARRIAAGVGSWWNPHAGGFNWAKGATGTSAAPSWTVLYPDAMESVWAVAYGLATPAQAASILSHLERMQPRWADPDQSATMAAGRGFAQQSVGYWPQAGWALTMAGQQDQAQNAAAAISAGAAAQKRTWPFTTGDAGGLIALQSGWPATAPWAAPPAGAGNFLGVVALTILAVVAAAVVATAALLSRKALARRRRSPGPPAPGAPWAPELVPRPADARSDPAAEIG